MGHPISPNRRDNARVSALEAALEKHPADVCDYCGERGMRKTHSYRPWASLHLGAMTGPAKRAERQNIRSSDSRIVDIRDGVRDEAAALDAAWAWVKLAPIAASSTGMDEIVARVHAQWGLAPETIRAEILKRYGEK
jgi:hypothetical protein